LTALIMTYEWGAGDMQRTREKPHEPTRVDLRVWYRGSGGAGYEVESEIAVG